MSKDQLDAMEAAALKLLREFINRSAAQHIRWMRDKWLLNDLATIVRTGRS